MKPWQWAVVAQCGIILLAVGASARADGALYGPLFRVQERGGWGFIDAAGRIVLPPTYEDAGRSFDEGLAPVKAGGKWGYVDRAGNAVIRPQFDSAQEFHQGLAAVFVGERVAGEGQGKWGYIDRSGRYVLGPDERLSYGGFESGLIPVRGGDKWGFNDTKGEQVITPRYKYAQSFSEGLAGVEGIEGGGDGFIDPAGKVVFRLARAKLTAWGFHEGLAAVEDEGASKIGYIDTKGKEVIAPRFDQAQEFVDGRAAVSITTADESGWPVRKWGFIDKAGTVVIPICYEYVGAFTEGLARVEAGGKYGFVDRDGNQVIRCQFNSAEPFQDGLAWVNVGGWSELGWSGYVYKAGRYVWRPSDYQKIDQARHDKENKPPTIRLFTDGKNAGKGLLVTCAKQVQAAGPHAGEVSIRVANLLDEEVFLEVTGLDSLAGTFESKDGGFFGGGGGFTIFPDNTNLLKRLHAAFYRKGEPMICGCCVARISSQVPPEAVAMGRARGHVTLWLRGYYRKTGKAFGESVDLPVEIVEWVKEGELLRPAGKP